ncbi:MAG TPA: transglutaminase family protein [Pseudolabrys sp.]|nr:transglutaminase family protein [Pseudolabrys sp.]
MRLNEHKAQPQDRSKGSSMEFGPFLSPGVFIDSDSPQVRAFALDAAGGLHKPVPAVVRLYTTVRDKIIYDPYVDFTDPANFRASSVLSAGRGFCVGKSALLAASARVLGVPARVGFADVRNHLTSPRLYAKIKTDTFVWHSYTELYLSGRWVKATPAFDSALCERAGLKALEFDGESDSLFHPFDPAGRRHMEYLKEHGTFADVPFETIRNAFLRAYPALMNSRGLTGDFRSEVASAETDGTR